MAARNETCHWLAAAVPRELNCDADTLFHPARWHEIRVAAESAGLSVRRVRAPAWHSLWGGKPHPGASRAGHIGHPIETVAGYVSALRSERHEVRSKALLRGVRRARGPRVTRRKGLGLRARHLQAAAAYRRIDRKRTWAARRRWMAAVVGHSLVARGCELGRTDNKAHSPSRGLRWRDIDWHAVGSLNPTHAALTVHLCAAKDGEGKGPRFPMQIRRRAVGNSAANDALCSAPTASYLPRGVRTRSCKARWRRSMHHLPQLRSGRGSVGIRDPRRAHDRTRDRPRISAPTPSVLKKRGRWRSDIAFIYARPSTPAWRRGATRRRQRPGHRVSIRRMGRARVVMADLKMPHDDARPARTRRGTSDRRPAGVGNGRVLPT